MRLDGNIVPPHCKEAEMAVLGGIMVDNSQLASALQILGAEDFYLGVHQRIFKATIALGERAVAIDPVTLKDELSRCGDLEWVGGHVYLASLLDGVPRSANVEFYARIVREASEKRRKVEEAARILEDLPSCPIEEDDIARLLRDVGLQDLGTDAPLGRAEAALRELRRRLNGADPLRRALIRAGAVRALDKAGISAPAAAVDAAFGRTEEDATKDAQGRRLVLHDPIPYPDSVEGADVIRELLTTLTLYLLLPPGCALAISLWIIHAHTQDAAHVSPIVAFRSATKRAGKTTALTLIGALVPRPLHASNVTGAALFRTVERFKPTLLVDEADSFLALSDELRGILNSGHTRSGAAVVRTVGEEHEPRLFSTWCPKAIALIGNLPSTLEDRSILITMRRRSPNEKTKRLRLDRLLELEPLRRKVARWSKENIDALCSADPEVPEELHDRASDNWRPLLAIADLCGASWSADARWAASTLSGSSDEREGSPPIQLLSDVRDLFRAQSTDRLASEDLIQALGAREDRPWSEWKQGKPITSTQLAKLLRPFGVRPKQVWLRGRNVKGYVLAEFEDPFTRYLPAEPLEPLETAQIAGSDAFRTPLENAPLADSKISASPYGQSVLAPPAARASGQSPQGTPNTSDLDCPSAASGRSPYPEQRLGE